MERVSNDGVFRVRFILLSAQIDFEALRREDELLCNYYSLDDYLLLFAIAVLLLSSS